MLRKRTKISSGREDHGNRSIAKKKRERSGPTEKIEISPSRKSLRMTESALKAIRTAERGGGNGLEQLKRDWQRHKRQTAKIKGGEALQTTR